MKRSTLLYRISLTMLFAGCGSAGLCFGTPSPIAQQERQPGNGVLPPGDSTSFAPLHDRVSVNPTDRHDSSAVSAAAEEPSGTIDQELIYSVNRTPEPPFNTARAVVVVTGDAIRRKNARTLPEALMEEAGIFVQQTNYGAGSPIIRGLVGKQILILVDGVKLNNAIYRFGPVQYLSTIDLNMVDRIEIVRGVGSVLGSDALGATINIITRKGPPNPQEMPIGGALFTRYSSADAASTGHGEIFGRSENFRYVAGVTYRSSEDLKSGADLGTQAATGYDEKAANFSFDYFPSEEQTFSFAYLALEQNRVPRTDKITDGTNLLFDFDPQRLQLIRLVYQDLAARKWSDFLQLTAYWNRQDEGRQEIRSDRPAVERRLSDAQTVLGLNLEMGSFAFGSHRLIYGIDYATEAIHSGRADVNLATSVSSSKRGNYTDGASYATFAVYGQDRFDVGEWLATTFGGRYSRFSSAGIENSSVGILDLKSSKGDITGTLNLAFHLTPHLNLITNATRGFRAPNLDDISVFDERSEGTEVPNNSLAPERIWTYLAGVKYSTARSSGSAFYHYSRLSDLLIRAPGTFNGLAYFDRNVNRVQEPTEPRVLQKKNIGSATIDGVELDGRYLINPVLTIWGNYTWTQGDDDLLNAPLSKIPPAFGALGVRWSAQLRRQPWAELVCLFAASQRRLSPADTTDSRIGPDGTAGFSVFTVRGGITVARNFRMTLALENLLDKKYKYHGSGVFRPGRQLVVAGQFTL